MRLGVYSADWYSCKNGCILILEEAACSKVEEISGQRFSVFTEIVLTIGIQGRLREKEAGLTSYCYDSKIFSTHCKAELGNGLVCKVCA